MPLEKSSSHSSWNGKHSRLIEKPPSYDSVQDIGPKSAEKPVHGSFLSRSSLNNNTYTGGADVGSLADRARHLGLESRATELEQARNRLWSRAVWAQRSTQIHLNAIALLDPERSASLSDLENEAIHDFHPRQPADLHADGSTLNETFLAILKSTIGPGLLYMPKGFQEGGIIFSVPMVILSYCLFSWGATRVLEVWATKRLSLAQLMGEAFGTRGAHVVHAVIFCQQCGICLTYFIFVATNMQEVAAALLGIENMSLVSACYYQLYIYVPLVMIRNIQHFTYTNLIANVFILYSLLVLGALATTKTLAGPTAPSSNNLVNVPHRAPISKHWLFNAESFYLSIGLSTFIFEGMAALVIPLQSAVREDAKHRFPALFVRTLALIIGIYIVFGLLNWLAYGDQVNAVLTVNMPCGGLKTSVQLTYTLAVIFTFPLQLFPAIQTARSVLPKLLRRAYIKVDNESHNETKGDAPARDPSALVHDISRKGAIWKKRCIGIVGRVLLVVVLCKVAISVRHNLTKILSLLGALLGIPLAYVFPSIIHLALMEDTKHYIRIINWCVVVLGVALCVACSTITFLTWSH